MRCWLQVVFFSVGAERRRKRRGSRCRARPSVTPARRDTPHFEIIVSTRLNDLSQTWCSVGNSTGGMVLIVLTGKDEGKILSSCPGKEGGIGCYI